MSTALVLRHDETIHLGNLEPVLVEHGYTVTYLDAVTDGSLDAAAAAAVAAADLLVVLGGEMGVYESDRFPVLRDEVALIRSRLLAEQPVFGVCLGAQLMANALGSAVYRGPSNQIGFRSVQATEAGAESPLRHLAGIPVLQWHSDTFDLPDGVTRLAGSADYANEAFALGAFALAVQFHPEVTEAMHEEWLASSLAEVAAEGYDPAELRRDRERYADAMQQGSRAMFSEWLDGLPG